MTHREVHTRPFLVSHPHHRNARAQAHSMLEAELQDIRRNLERLERELEKNVVEMRRRKRENNRAA